MFKEYQKKKASFWEIIKKHFLLLIAVIIVGSGLYTATFMLNQLSSKQKKEYKKIIEQEKALRKKIEIYVVDAGYLRKYVSSQESYIPALIIQVTNKSEKVIDKLKLRSFFSMNEKNICSDSFQIEKFNSGEKKEVMFNCMESIGFGTVLRGVSLIQTTEECNYEVVIESEGICVTFLKNKLKYKILTH